MQGQYFFQSIIDVQNKGSILSACWRSIELEELGDYEAATVALGSYWQGIGVRPLISGLSIQEQALLLLRIGSLTGWLGSSQQIANAQELAKDIITEAGRLFDSIPDIPGSILAQSDLSVCYWREGAYEEAEAILNIAFNRLSNEYPKLKSQILLRLANVLIFKRSYSQLLVILEKAENYLVEASLILKGKFFSLRALAYKRMAEDEDNQDNRSKYFDSALRDYAGASYYYELTGHKRYRARVENNLGSLLLEIGRYEDAQEHLVTALHLFHQFEDIGTAAQVQETIARLYLATGDLKSAENFAQSSVNMLQHGGELSALALSLTTLGLIQSRLSKTDSARANFEEAVKLALQVGDLTAAAISTVTLLEEITDSLTSQEFRRYYSEVNDYLSLSSKPDISLRLTQLARKFSRESEEQNKPNSTKQNNIPFFYNDPRTTALINEVNIIAPLQVNILLIGETGTGKEVLAHSIHQLSGRQGNFITVNCAAVPDSLFESQVFGHQKGSFTDAVQDHQGFARAANGGTLFLDEIGDLCLVNQAKLLRLVEYSEVQTIGLAKPGSVDIRLIVATNRNLEILVEKGQFRADLFYRLSNYTLLIPPLRERPEDISILARHFLKEVAIKVGKKLSFSERALLFLSRLSFPGNVRELKALVERLAIFSPDEIVIGPDFLIEREIHQKSVGKIKDFSFNTAVLEFEEKLIKAALKDADGEITEAAKLLGVKHQTLSKMLRERHKGLSHIRKNKRAKRGTFLPIKEDSVN